LFVVAQLSVVPMMFADRNAVVWVWMSVPVPPPLAALVTAGVTVATSGAARSAEMSASARW
jgi:hypothetical protein